MAFPVHFYKFEKLPNSTKVPESGGEVYRCNLIEPASIFNPEIALVLNENPVIYNYAYIPEFSRYYFVNDWSYSSGRWRAQLTVDALASFREDIGKSSQYILRSSAEFDTDVVDSHYPAKGGTITETVTSESGNPFTNVMTEGTYIVGIVNGDRNAVGATSFYAFTNAQFRALSGALMGDPAWVMQGIEEIGEELTKALFNPFQYVTSCIWLPYKVSGAAVNELMYGWWTLPVTCSRLAADSVRLADASFINIPKHPQSGTKGRYLNNSPYTRYTIYWPVFGTISLDPSLLYNADRISCQCYIDNITGKGCLSVMDPDGGILYQSSNAQVGVPVQLSQMANDYLGAAGNIAGLISNVAMGDFSALANIGNVAASIMPKVQTQGSAGSTGVFRFAPVLQCEFLKIVDDSKDKFGRPLCKNRTISELPGYIMTTRAALEIPATSSEIESIISFMNGGFYYE